MFMICSLGEAFNKTLSAKKMNCVVSHFPKLGSKVNNIIWKIINIFIFKLRIFQ